MKNKVIEDYLLQDQIGKGQYGKVYKAQNLKKPEEYVAIKVITNKKFSQIPKLEELTRNEINLLSTIKNPNVVKFIEMLRTTNNMYMVYELCDGGNLEEHIQKKKKLPESEALHLFKQIVNACYSLKQWNILHRDLKL